MSLQIIHFLGADLTDQVFTIVDNDGEEITWNVTKLQEAAARGEFGQPRILRTSDLKRPIYDNVDHDKVEAIKYLPDFLNTPGIGIGRFVKHQDEADIFCIADGNHRIIARQEMRLPTFSLYVVPPEVERNFRVMMIEREI